MRMLVCVAVIAIGSAPAPASAQSAPDFSQLHVNVGDKVYVTDLATGVEVSGPLTSLTPTEMAINGHVCAGTRAENREGWRSVWDGTLIAAARHARGDDDRFRGMPPSLVGHAVSGALSYGLIGALSTACTRGAPITGVRRVPALRLPNALVDSVRSVSRSHSRSESVSVQACWRTACACWSILSASSQRCRRLPKLRVGRVRQTFLRFTQESGTPFT